METPGVLLVLCGYLKTPGGRRMRSGKMPKSGKVPYRERVCRSLARLSLDADIAEERLISSSEKMVEALGDNPIALTGGLFETRPINDGNFAALVSD